MAYYACDFIFIINNNTFYLFKIFLRFWLVKIPRIIHHNQLFKLTKFGIILWYWTDDVILTAKLIDYWTDNWEFLEQVEVCLVVSTKWRNILLVSRWTIVWKHSKNSKKTTRRTTSAIWNIFVDLNSPLSPKLPDKHALSRCTIAMF